MGTRRGAKGWLIRLGNRLRAVRNLPPIQRGRPAENIGMIPTSTQFESRLESASMFGEDIGAAVDSDGVNRFVKWCVAAILETGNGLDTDALYRANGGLEEIRKIQEQSECGMQEVLNQETNVHVLTGALKLFFRSLKQPILRIEDFQDVLEGDQQKKLGQVIARQPQAESKTLAFFMQHLQEVLQHPDNHMDTRALAIVFGPTFMRMRNDEPTNMEAEMAAQSRLVALLLEHGHHVFPTRSSVAKSVSREESSCSSYEEIPASHREQRDAQDSIPVAVEGSICSSYEGIPPSHREKRDTQASIPVAVANHVMPGDLRPHAPEPNTHHVTLRNTDRQPSVGKSPSVSSDEDGWNLDEAEIGRSNGDSAPWRRDVTRLSTIATSIRVNVPTAL